MKYLLQWAFLMIIGMSMISYLPYSYLINVIMALTAVFVVGFIMYTKWP